VRGNRLAIVLLGLSAGSGGRVALAFLKKNMDTCFKSSEEIDSVKPSLLAKLPDLTTCGRVFTSKTKPSDAGVRRSLDHGRDFYFYFFSSSLPGLSRAAGLL